MTRQEFESDYKQSHPQPSEPEYKTFTPVPFYPGPLLKVWRIYAALLPIAVAIFVSILRTQGSFYSIARKNDVIFGLIDLSVIESIGAAILFDIGMVALMSERTVRIRRNRALGWIDIGLAICFVVTAVTNAQQGFIGYKATLDAADDVGRFFGTVFVLLLSAGVPTILAILGNVLGEMIVNHDDDNIQAKQAAEQANEQRRKEIEQANEQKRTVFEQTNKQYAERMAAAWARHERTSKQAAEQAERSKQTLSFEQSHEQTGVVREQAPKRASPNEHTTNEQVAQGNGHIPNDLLIQLFTEHPAASMTFAATWLGERGHPTERNKVYRAALAMVGNGLRKQENKFYVDIDHDGQHDEQSDSNDAKEHEPDRAHETEQPERVRAADLVH